MATLQNICSPPCMISNWTPNAPAYSRVLITPTILPTRLKGPAYPGLYQSFPRQLHRAKDKNKVYCASEDSDSTEKDEIRTKVEEEDWRAFRAKLVKGTKALERVAGGSHLWAHPLVAPETGCLLLAHPSAFGIHQTYFNQAVIFLFSHTEAGSAGLILNRPTQYTLGQLEGYQELMPELKSCPLYLGGDVGQHFTHVVHGVQSMKGTLEIIPGVYMGGFSSIKESIKSGESSASDYRWFMRYAGWGPGQLQREVAAGVWFVACSSKDFILQQCIKLPKPLWRQVLETMGDQYVEISRRTYGEL